MSPLLHPFPSFTLAPSQLSVLFLLLLLYFTPLCFWQSQISLCVCVCTVVKSCSSYEVISHMVSLYFACNGKCSLPETPLCQLPTLVLLLTFLCVYCPSFSLFHPFALILFPFIIPLNSSHSLFNLPPILLSTFSFLPLSSSISSSLQPL